MPGENTAAAFFPSFPFFSPRASSASGEKGKRLETANFRQESGARPDSTKGLFYKKGLAGSDRGVGGREVVVGERREHVCKIDPFSSRLEYVAQRQMSACYAAKNGTPSG